MVHTIQVQVPDEEYNSLKEVAEQSGLSPEKVASDLLSNAIRIRAEDPLAEFIGAFPSNSPGWTERHDEYLGIEALNRSSEENKGRSE